MDKKQSIVVICGPTASGKTSLALQLAKELPRASVLSVDSRQVYQEIDIVTGKDIPRDLPNKITFFGLDLFKPNEVSNIADFSKYAKKIIHDSSISNTPLIVVGGTGLYLKSITESLSNISIPPNPKLRKELEQLSLIELQEKLKKINPDKYSSLNHSDMMNPRRLIRSIEISQSKDLPTIQVQPQKQNSYIWIGLLPNKNAIKENIKKRVIGRLKNGAIGEVKKLLEKYPDHSLPVFSSLGVSQIHEYIDKKISKEKLIEMWTNAEVNYARRQIVWFKKQPNIVWYDKSSDHLKLVAKLKKIYTNHD